MENQTDPVIKKILADLFNESHPPKLFSIKHDMLPKRISKQNTDEPKYKNLVLSGGSTKGIAHIGGIQRLVEKKLIDLSKLQALAGSSAGALIGCLVTVGFTIEEIWEFILCLNMQKLVNPDIFMFLKKCGLDTGQTIYNLIEEILTQKTGIKHINFRQLYEITKIHFTVVGSCLTTKEIIYYDYINMPNFKVSTAIRISIGMPGFFVPVIIDGKQYIDGAILNDYPMNLFSDKLDETIGILICDEYDTEYKCPEQYFMAIINLFKYHYYYRTQEKYIDNTVYVRKNFPNVSIFNFDMDNNTKNAIYDAGVSAVDEFIQQHLIAP